MQYCHAISVCNNMDETHRPNIKLKKVDKRVVTG